MFWSFLVLSLLWFWVSNFLLLVWVAHKLFVQCLVMVDLLHFCYSSLLVVVSYSASFVCVLSLILVVWCKLAIGFWIILNWVILLVMGGCVWLVLWCMQAELSLDLSLPLEHWLGCSLWFLWIFQLDHLIGHWLVMLPYVLSAICLWNLWTLVLWIGFLCLTLWILVCLVLWISALRLLWHSVSEDCVISLKLGSGWSNQLLEDNVCHLVGKHPIQACPMHLLVFL